jgi:hypothetical protein
MGKYFAPPRMRDKKSWEIMRRLAYSGLSFLTVGARARIRAFVIPRKSPAAVSARIAELRRAHNQLPFSPKTSVEAQSHGRRRLRP